MQKTNSNLMIKLFACMTLAAFTVLLNIRCSINPVADSEAGNPVILSSTALINIPTSLASAAIERNTDQPFTRPAGNDKARDIYSFIRLQNFYVNELVNGNSLSVKWLIEHYIAKLPWKLIRLNGSLSSDSSLYHFEAHYDPDSALPYSATISYSLPGSEWVVKTAFNGSEKTPKGWVYYFFNAPQDNRTDSCEILVSFEKTGTCKLLEVAIDQKLLVDTGDLAQSFKYSLCQENRILHLSGSSYHPFMDSILGDTMGYCYTYTAVADTLLNRAVVNLGLPPASYADTTLLFTSYGIADIYGRYFIAHEINNLSDTSKMILSTSFKDSMSILQILDTLIKDPNFKLRPASDADSMTVADLIFYLELNKNILPLLTLQDQIKYMELLWILKLRQPVYFTWLGYAGNGDKIPAGFEAIAATTCNRPRFIPLSIKEMKIIIP